MERAAATARLLTRIFGGLVTLFVLGRTEDPGDAESEGG